MTADRHCDRHADRHTKPALSLSYPPYNNIWRIDYLIRLANEKSIVSKFGAIFLNNWFRDNREEWGRLKGSIFETQIILDEV